MIWPTASFVTTLSRRFQGWRLPLRGILPRTAIAFCGVAIAVGCATIPATVWIAHLRDQRAVNEELARLLEAVKQPLEIACLTDDRILAAEIARGLLSNSKVSSVRIGQSTRILFERDDDWIAQGKVYEGIQRGLVESSERILRRKDGSRFWCFLSGTSLPSATPTSTALWLFEDVTWRKAAEEALIEARTTAEATTRSKSMFLANTSHAIRTPLTTVTGFSQALIRTDLTADQRDCVDKIIEAGNELIAIIDNVLDVSKIDAGKLTLELCSFDLFAVLDNIAQAVRQEAQAKNLDIIFDCPPNLPRTLVGDPLRLSQILNNLAGNALKFTDHGQIVISVVDETPDSDDVRLRFTVCDSGIGIPLDRLDEMFAPFVQGDHPNPRKQGGAGLGLSISRDLVELMGGTLHAESAPGYGSSFSFDMPFRIDPGEEERLGPLPDYLNRMHVLIIERTAVAREIRERVLRAYGFRVDLVDTPNEALDRIRQNDGNDPYRVMFIDDRIPELDCTAFSQVIKSEMRLTSPPDIILLASSAAGTLAYHARRAGIDASLTKPVSPLALDNTLRALFSDSVPKPPSTDQSATAAIKHPELRGCRALVVEDQDSNRQVLIAFLKRVGIDCDVAVSGGDAIKRLRSDSARYDFVLMDVQMPEMDGYTATRIIRSDARCADLPIIAVTAYAMTDERERCLAAGMNDHVTKPIVSAALYDTLARWQTKRAPTLQSLANDKMTAVVPGLDLAGGVANCDGKFQEYGNRLTALLTEVEGSLAEIEFAQSDGVTTPIKQRARAIASMAHRLGAQDLARHAATLAESCANAASVIEPVSATAQLRREACYLRWAWTRLCPPSCTPDPTAVSGSVITSSASCPERLDGSETRQQA